MGCIKIKDIKVAVKYILFVLNVIFVIAGVVVLAVGAYLKTRDVPVSIKELWSTLNIVAIVVGAVVAAVAFLGCFGALLENKIMLYLYTVSLLILAIAQTVMVVMIFRKRHEMHEHIPMYEYIIKDNAKVQQFLYIFELVIVGLALLIILFQVLAAVVSGFFAYAQRTSKLIEVQNI